MPSRQPGSDTHSPVAAPLGAYSNWYAPGTVPVLRMKWVAGSAWVAVQPAMIAPAALVLLVDVEPVAEPVDLVTVVAD